MERGKPNVIRSFVLRAKVDSLALLVQFPYLAASMHKRLASNFHCFIIEGTWMAKVGQGLAWLELINR